MDIDPKVKAPLIYPVVETEVRRSLRFQGKNKGFRSATCLDKHCLGCSAEPPLFSHKIIRNLGESFCKVSTGILSEDSINRKRKNKQPIGRKSVPKKNDSDSSTNDDKKKTKKK